MSTYFRGILKTDPVIGIPFQTFRESPLQASRRQPGVRGGPAPRVHHPLLRRGGQTIYRYIV